MTLDRHEEAWLHSGLESLLTAEPPMLVPVGDDVRRGALALAAARRRRTAALSVAALVLAVGVPSALVLRATPSPLPPSRGAASGSTASEGPSPTAPGSPAPTTVAGVLEAAGWVVETSATSDPQPTGAIGVQTRYDLRRTAGVASILVTVYAPGQATTDVLASCTASTCSPAYVGTSRLGPGGFRDDSRLVTQAPDLPVGSLVVDRVFDSGTTVEVGVALVKPLPGSAATPGLALTADEVLALLAVVGDPYAGPAAQASLAASSAASASAEAAAAADAELARRHPCRAEDLVVTQPGQDGAGGMMLYGLVLHNRSGAPCGLVGFPSVRLVGTGGPLPLVTHRSPGGPGTPMPVAVPALLLEPEGDAHSLVTKYRCDSGTVAQARELQVSVDGTAPWVTLPLREWLCSGGAADPGNQLDVYGFYPGVSG